MSSHPGLLSGPRRPRRHRQHTLPPVERTEEGGIVLFRRLRDNVLHREDGPALLLPEGSSVRLGEDLSLGGPAQLWYRDGKLARPDDLPVVVGGTLTTPDRSARIAEAWLDGNELHRDGGPAVVYEDGEVVEAWYQHGLIHRDDGPAVVRRDGGFEWLQHGEPHREDGPAIETGDGTKEWWLNGEFHRDDGPALEGPKREVWFRDGALHREDGPALQDDGTEEWWLNGQPHRQDGPACSTADGKREWWLNGQLGREDGPAVIVPEGASYDPESEWGQFDFGLGVVEGPAELWLRESGLHREDGPAVVLASGVEQWHQFGELHREDSPAVIVPEGHRWDGGHGILRDHYRAAGLTPMELRGPAELWFRHGKPHRVSGPAITDSNGHGHYWLYGEHLDKSEWESRRRYAELQEKQRRGRERGQLETTRFLLRAETSLDQIRRGGHYASTRALKRPEVIKRLAAELASTANALTTAHELGWRVAVEECDELVTIYALTKDFASADQARAEVEELQPGAILEWGVRDRQLEHELPHHRAEELRQATRRRLGIKSIILRALHSDDAEAAVEQRARQGDRKAIEDLARFDPLVSCYLGDLVVAVCTTACDEIEVLTIEGLLIDAYDDGISLAREMRLRAMGDDRQWSAVCTALNEHGIEARRDDLLDLPIYFELDERVEPETDYFWETWPGRQFTA